MIHQKQLNNQPFYCWECVSIKHPERTIDFVIKDPVALMALVRIVQIEITKNDIFKIEPPTELSIFEKGKDMDKKKARVFRD
jgi:hypothetical protein